MILTDIDIITFRNLDWLAIHPWNPEAVQPASYDLHLAPYLKRQAYSHGSGVTWIQEKFAEDCRGGLFYDLEPGEFLLFSTIETVMIGAGLAAQVSGKSSHAREGLVTENAGWVDPGFEGELTLEFSNLSPYPIRLDAGMPICQIVFMQTRSPAQRPYGYEGLGSKYQHQKGPTSAR